jgi:hypothetical protein
MDMIKIYLIINYMITAILTIFVIYLFKRLKKNEMFDKEFKTKYLNLVKKEKIEQVKNEIHQNSIILYNSGKDLSEINKELIKLGYDKKLIEEAISILIVKISEHENNQKELINQQKPKKRKGVEVVEEDEEDEEDKKQEEIK